MAALSLSLRLLPLSFEQRCLHTRTCSNRLLRPRRFSVASIGERPPYLLQQQQGKKMSKRLPFKDVEAARPAYGQAGVTDIKTPNPDWKPGSGPNGLAPSGHGSTVEIDPSDYPTSRVYRMLNSAVIPRPIAFVSTVNKEGAINLAPFSYFNLASSNPPTLMISFTHSKPSEIKETCQNILDEKEFCVSIISENFIEAANFTSIDCPAGVSEWALAGLTPVANKLIKAPRVKESAFSMECELMQHHDILNDAGLISATVVIGRIRNVNVLEDVLDKDTLAIDTAKLAPAGRLGGLAYSKITGMYELERPAWKDWEGKEELRDLIRTDEQSKI